MREVLVLDPDGRPRDALQALQHVESALAPVALERVGRVGDLLQLAKDELGDDQRAVEEAHLAEVHDATVDDHGGVEDLESLAARGGLGEELGRHVLELVPLGERDRGAQVGEEQAEEPAPERPRVGGDGAHGRPQPEPEPEPHDAAHGAPEDPVHRDAPRLPLEQHGQHPEEEAGAAEPPVGRVNAERRAEGHSRRRWPPPA